MSTQFTPSALSSPLQAEEEKQVAAEPSVLTLPKGPRLLLLKYLFLFAASTHYKKYDGRNMYMHTIATTFSKDDMEVMTQVLLIHLVIFFMSSLFVCLFAESGLFDLLCIHHGLRLGASCKELVGFTVGSDG